jgi:GNAT superfamily N-acetyltransferase
MADDAAGAAGAPGAAADEPDVAGLVDFLTTEPLAGAQMLERVMRMVGIPLPDGGGAGAADGGAGGERTLSRLQRTDALADWLVSDAGVEGLLAAGEAVGLFAAPRDGSGADSGGAAASNAAPPCATAAVSDVSALVVRVACASDIDAVLRLQTACHPPALHESASCLASILAHGASHVAHDTATGSVLAYALAHSGSAAALGAVVPPPSAAGERERCVYLHDVAVSPAAQRTGFARLLVYAVLACAEAAGASEAHLVALPGTTVLWARFGFEPCAADDAASYGPGATHMRARLAGAG